MMANVPWHDLSFDLRGVRIAYRARDGRQPLLMIHGIGPGTTAQTNFGPLIDRLSAEYAPHLMDLAGFGASGRLSHMPFFDVQFWLEQIDVAIGHVYARHGCLPILIGNSVGGALVLKTLARRDDLPAAMVIGAPAQPVVPPELAAFWSPPMNAATLAAAMQPMNGAARAPDPAIVAARFSLFSDGTYGTYFREMLADPLACLSSVMTETGALAQITTPVTVIHGRLDRACPLSGTLAILPQLPHADFVLLGGCGHNVISERPTEIVSVLEKIACKVANP